MKVCTKCDERLPETAFYWDNHKDRPPRRRAQCIACTCVMQTRNNESRRDDRKAYNRQRRASGKDVRR